MDIRKGIWLLSPRNRDGLNGFFVPPLVASPVLFFVEGKVNSVYARNIQRLPYKFLDSLNIVSFNNFVEGERWNAARDEIVDLSYVRSVSDRSVGQLRIVLRYVFSNRLRQCVLIAAGNTKVANKGAIGSFTPGNQRGN